MKAGWALVTAHWFFANGMRERIQEVGIEEEEMR
jgi:hypothetical protein